MGTQAAVNNIATALGSNRTLVTLLRFSVRRLTMIISALWLRTSSTFTWEEGSLPESLENDGQLLSGCEIVRKIAPTSLSRDRSIKDAAIYQSFPVCFQKERGIS